MEQLISELLLRHNCVILPSFGGFIAKKMSATINYQTGTILPPRKSILFNKQLLHNDGLLISFYAQQHQVNYDQAAIHIKKAIVDWQERLQNGQHIEIEKVGRLFLDLERNICFEQDRFSNLLLDAYGLGKVHFIPQQDLKIVEQEQKIEEKVIEILEKEVPKPTPSVPHFERAPIVSIQKSNTNAKKILRYAAAALLIPIGFYSFWIPLKTDVIESGIITLEDFNPFTPKKIVIPASNPSNKQVKHDAPKEKEIIPEPSENLTVETPEENIPPVETPKAEPAPVTKNTTEKYFVIVGCFGNEENANQLVRLLQSKGLPAIIEGESKGLKRVAAGAASTLEEAKSIQNLSRNAGYEGWILTY